MPIQSDYVVDPLLTNIAKSYVNANLIADQVAPRVNVENETGYYLVGDKSAFRVEKDLRTGISRANRVGYNLSLAHYGPLLEHSLEQGIPYRERDIMGEDVAMRRATNNVQGKVDLNNEVLIAAMFANTAIATQNATLSGTDQFDNALSDPIAKVQAAKDVIIATGVSGVNGQEGKWVVFMGYQVWTKLRNNTALRAALNLTINKAPLTTEQVATLLDVDEVFYGAALQDTAKEGQTPSLGYVWGKNLWVAWMPTSDAPSIDMVAPAYTLQLADNQGNSARYVDTWDDQSQKTIFVRANDFYEAFMVAVEALYLYVAAVS